MTTKVGSTAAFNYDDQDTELNADYTQILAVDTHRQSWQSSPAAGVMRKRLEVAGVDQPRLTTVVKFEPGSSFDAHGHDGGEEFIVLSGVFSDTSGDYPEGSYVRNPPGSFHAPFTEQGCVILVKLRQFLNGDDQPVAMQTGDLSAHWVSSTDPGVWQLGLHQYQQEQVDMYRINPQCWISNRQYTHGLELFVCDGDIAIADQGYGEGCWLRFPAGSRLRISSRQGARIYMKQGGFAVSG